MQLNSLQKGKEKNSRDKKINSMERLYELEQKFVCHTKVTESKSDYNALHDIHAFQYFANKSVQKHLKRLSKVLLIQNSSQVMNIVPQTHENKIIKKQIDHIIGEKLIKQPKASAVGTTHKRNHSEIQVQSPVQIQSIHPINLSLRQKKEIQLTKLLDPYATPNDQLILEKRKKLMQNLQRKKRQSFDNPPKLCLPKIEKQQPSNQSERQISKNFLNRLKVGMKIHENQAKCFDKISKNNENQHQKLVNMINKKRTQAKNSSHNLNLGELTSLEVETQGK